MLGKIGQSDTQISPFAIGEKAAMYDGSTTYPSVELPQQTRDKIKKVGLPIYANSAPMPFTYTGTEDELK